MQIYTIAGSRRRDFIIIIIESCNGGARPIRFYLVKLRVIIVIEFKINKFIFNENVGVMIIDPHGHAIVESINGMITARAGCQLQATEIGYEGTCVLDDVIIILN